MSGTSALRAAVAAGDLAEVERILAGDPGSVRTLIALTYQPDPAVRDVAASGLAVAARHYPRLVEEAVRRLIWAMNDESGTNAVHAPAVIARLAETEPKLLVPVLSDLLRLTADPGLRDELVTAVRRVAAQFPGEAAGTLRRGLGQCLEEGRGHDL